MIKFLQSLQPGLMRVSVLVHPLPLAKWVYGIEQLQLP